MSTTLFPDASPVAKASDLVAMLRRAYGMEDPIPPGVLAVEIEAPDGTRRADAVFAPWNRKAGLIGHEVKVSRSDVLAELADPMKCDPWLRYCSRWWLVVAHPSLVDGLAVPEHWGIMAPPSGRLRRQMTVVRPAPALKPAETGPGWQRIASWDHQRLLKRYEDEVWKRNSAEHERDSARREADELRASGIGRADERSASIGRIVGALGRDWWLGREDFEADVIAAVKDLQATRRLAQSVRSDIEYMARRAREIAQPVDRVAAELERLASREPSR